MEKQTSSALATRQALVSAALRLFGEHGYDSVSTRQIADAANANIGSIAYHFGGKPGLRTACAQYVSGAVREALAPEFPDTLQDGLQPDAAARMLIGMLSTFVKHTTQQTDSDDISTFVMREMVCPGEVMQHLYRDLIGPAHDRMCRLFAIATGTQASLEDISVIVFSLMGQSMYFRMSKPIVIQHMKWDDIGASESEKIIEVLEMNLRALVAYYRNDGRPQLIRASG